MALTDREKVIAIMMIYAGKKADPKEAILECLNMDIDVDVIEQTVIDLNEWQWLISS